MRVFGGQAHHQIADDEILPGRVGQGGIERERLGRIAEMKGAGLGPGVGGVAALAPGEEIAAAQQQRRAAAQRQPPVQYLSSTPCSGNLCGRFCQHHHSISTG